MRPLSRGYVESKSNRPNDEPAVNTRYLSEESDRRASGTAAAVRRTVMAVRSRRATRRFDRAAENVEPRMRDHTDMRFGADELEIRKNASRGATRSSGAG
jgi:choline dehydrogenase-like flavoprotein